MASSKGYGECPYGDENIKYPLPLDKSRIPYNNTYVIEGGVQLMEMMEKEFSFEWIKQNQKKLYLNDRQVETLGWWIKNDWRLQPTVEDFRQWLEREKAAGRDDGERNESTIASLVKYIFVGYKGIFLKLLKIADVKPRLDKDGKISFLYSFISNEVNQFDNGSYRIISIRFEDRKLQKAFDKIHPNIFIYEKTNDDGWKYVEDDQPIYEDIQSMLEITEKLITF